MPSITTPAYLNDIVAAESLLELAGFCDEQAQALSFYFRPPATPDSSHRAEIVVIKGLIRQVQDNCAPQKVPTALAKDLDEILVTAQDISHRPGGLKVIFACREMKLWQEFELPAGRSISILEAGRRFRLAPLLSALQACAPYCVVILESGKARAFVVRGTEIREIEGYLANEDISLHADDSRVGWSKHIERNLAEHEKAYFARLVRQLSEFMAKQQTSKLLIGCREDLWGEVGKQFAGLASELVGHFHFTNFELTPAQVLKVATPVLEEARRQRCVRLLDEINENPSRSALGPHDVLYSLSAGRVQTLVVGTISSQTISECLDCRRMWTEAGDNCRFCDSARVRYLAGEEGLIRQALMTDAEILLIEENQMPGFSGVAALLRY